MELDTAKGAEVIAYGNEFGVVFFTKAAPEEKQKLNALSNFEPVLR
ncbi:MAG: hypothetical protein MZV63_49050 [Marinilabiliales bacterium]|nr:hypothetical protein [Marinilabiliales bacterium]